MTYSMTFDNSGEVMTEDEMYDVNGGLWRWRASTFIGNMMLVLQGVALYRFYLQKVGVNIDRLKFLLNTTRVSFPKATALFGKALVKIGGLLGGPIGIAIGQFQRELQFFF